MYILNIFSTFAQFLSIPIAIMIISDSNRDYNSMSDDRLALMLGEFIKYHRIEKNLSQEELGTSAGLSRPTISLMERGKSMNMNSVIRVLRVLDLLFVFDAVRVSQKVSPMELLKMQEKQRKHSSKKRS